MITRKNNNDIKKTWSKPRLIELDIKETKGGFNPENAEDMDYDTNSTAPD